MQNNTEKESIRKWVLITGSSKGLGRSLALVFAENGYNIVIHGKDKDKLEEVRKEVSKYGVNCEVAEGDLISDETIEKLAEVGKGKNISVLINNAAVGSNKEFSEYNSEELQKIIKVNLTAPMELTKKLYELFVRKKDGIIININSMDALKITKPGKTAYSTSKFGLRGFTDALRFESKKYNIRVIGVYLSGMKTDMSASEGDISKNMEPLEVARVIYDTCKNYESLQVDEIVLGRMKY